MTVAQEFFGGSFSKFGTRIRKKKKKDIRGGYLSYLRRWKGTDLSYDAKHLILIAMTIDRMVCGELDRVRIHMPPRHGKTTTVTAQLPCYLLERDPKCRILIMVHTLAFGRRLGRKIRNQCQKRGIELSKDNASTISFGTDAGGCVIICGVGAPPTGEGFDWIIIDDPIKTREQAESLTFRDKLDDQYGDEIYTRLEPGGKIIGIWTLWHEDDLAGRLDARAEDGEEEADKWTVVKLAAIAGDNDALGRARGEPLWPERYPLEALSRIRANMMRKTGLRGWEALYQQNPTPLDGDIFMPSMIKIVLAVPIGLKWFRAYDVAATANGTDYTASVQMAEDKDGTVYMRHASRFKLDTGQRDKKIVAQAHEDGEDVTIILPEDPAAAGKSQPVYWSRQLGGFRFLFRRPKGTKPKRAEALSAQVNIGNVCMLKGPWNGMVLEEMRTFPNGVNDDLVDAAGDCYREVVGGKRKLGRAY